MSRPQLATLAALLVVVLATGCSQRVVIESVPSGAEVAINGTPIGTTPVSQRLDASSWWLTSAELSVSLPGYRTVRGPLDWRYDPRHWWLLTLAWFPPSQIAHAHPRFHRRPLDRYVVVLDEDLGAGEDRRERIYGRIDPTSSPVALEAEPAAAAEPASSGGGGFLESRRRR